MNEFTKEELDFMADGIVLMKEKCQMIDSIRAKLNALDKKLCDMINNYCKHDNRGIIEPHYCLDCKSYLA